MIDRLWYVIALVAAIVANILANNIASLLEKVIGNNKRIKKLSPKQQLLIVIFLFLLFSSPTIYQEITDSDFNSRDISVENVVVRYGETSTAFDGDVIITLDNLHASSCNTADFTIGSPGFPDVVVKARKIGAANIFQGRYTYDVRFWEVTVNCIEISFRVTRVNSKPLPDGE